MKATPSATRRTFGHLPDGRAVEAVTLTQTNGMSATILAWGATLQAMLVPDREGTLADVTLGHATLGDYLASDAYFGASVGRVANRIAGGRFILDGEAYRVPANNGSNALHGGPVGFDRALWTIAAVGAAPQPMVRLAHVSPDGDQGFPGTLHVTATYTLTDAGELAIEYAARTDRPTLVNLTNHAYWNLAGEGGVEGAMDHVLAIPAEHFLPTDEAAIPTGEFAPVAGTPFDFREPTAIGARVRDAGHPQIAIGRGYDHNWVIARTRAAEPRLLAALAHPGSGRSLAVFSTEPGVQFYSGNFLGGTLVGKAGKAYRQGDGIALEPQMFPDTPNRPDFGSVRLAPGETYRHRVILRFGGES
ncbi:aldose epimerase family protein [Erythrobacter sp. WG]|uniref:aldose epimerase family protein n=1 Tax=Erythrobacter sp. WG TaxID=2985510 RepID=UPI00226E6591|nr:aldose epimerase family protein [Erythrobacter sp. WG]MCX9147921.1 galactose mutarotase [Erythrobacter sp. WG]